MRDIQYEVCRILKSVLQARAPYDTGNLAINSIRISADHTAVLIGGVDIAPYAIFTNEPWTASKWNGKLNPNEGWVERAIQEAIPLVQQSLSGNMSEDEFDAIMAKYRDVYDGRMAQRIKLLRVKKEKI